MNRVLSLFALLSLAVLFVSCGSKYTCYKYNAAVMEESGKAVVFTKLGMMGVMGMESQAEFVLVKLDGPSSEMPVKYSVGKGLFRPLSPSNMNPWNRPYEMLMIEPGVYAFENIMVHKGNLSYATILGSLKIL